VIPVAYYMQSTYIFEHKFQEISQLIQLSVTPTGMFHIRKKISKYLLMVVIESFQMDS